VFQLDKPFPNDYCVAISVLSTYPILKVSLLSVSCVKVKRQKLSDLELKKHDQGHRHLREAIETHHKTKDESRNEASL
jgi:hypothetical protein